MSSASSPFRPIPQAGTMPFREGADGDPEFLLVTSSTSGRYVFPKGMIDSGRTPQEQALLETFEEAGVRGELLEPAIGWYEYTKWDSILRVQMYLLHVTEELVHWPEKDERQRLWVPFRQVPFKQSRPEAQEVVGSGIARAIQWLHLRKGGMAG